MKHSLLPALLVAGLTVPPSFAIPGLYSDEPPANVTFAPYLHLTGAVGSSSNDHPEELTVGHHDPSREDGTIQGLEAGFTFYAPSLRLGGAVTGSLSYGAEEEWEEELEEAFFLANPLFDEFEIRAGRMLSRFGQRNTQHVHSWSTVDTPLALGAFLGDEGLGLDGADISWRSASVHPWGITLGFGKAPSHGHGEDEEEHGHEEEDEHHEDEDEHGHDEHEEEGEHHEDEDGHDEHLHEEGFADTVFTARLYRGHTHSDFVSGLLGASIALGDTDEGETVSVVGVDLSIRWRENGLQPGGRALTWTTEALRQHTDETGSRLGAYSEVIYSPGNPVDLGFRADWLEEEEGDHNRFSPFATWFPGEGNRGNFLRLQANFDDTPEGSDETIWLQFNLSWISEGISL